MAIPGQYTTLRVRTPQTIDGINLATDDDGNTIFNETELPITARKELEKANLKLPTHLRKKITVMNYHDQIPAAQIVKGVGVDMLKADTSKDDEIALLKAKLALLEGEDEETEENELDPGNTNPAKKSVGRPRKITENA